MVSVQKTTDLFGRIGNNVEHQVTCRPSADDVAAVRLSLLAEAAIDYFGIDPLSREAALLQQTVNCAYASVLQLVTSLRAPHVCRARARARARAGASESDVAQASARGRARAPS